MIRDVRGDILTANTQAIVNPVNTYGVMGAGLARQFRDAYPDMYQQYRADCGCARDHRQASQSAVVRIGHVRTYLTGRRPTQYVVNFPTKTHWREPSHLDYIETGLVSLRSTILDLGIRTIAIPPLGCGLGGLAWPDVRKLIVARLGDLTEVDVMLYESTTAARSGYKDPLGKRDSHQHHQ